MITDPKDEVHNRDITLKGGSVHCKNNYVGSHFHGVWSYDDPNHELGIRIIMNVIDFKKLMESNQ